MKNRIVLNLLAILIYIICASSISPGQSDIYPTGNTIALNKESLTANDCCQDPLKKAKPVTQEQMKDLFRNAQELLEKYPTIDNCCTKRALYLAEIAQKKGFEMYLAYNISGKNQTVESNLRNILRRNNISEDEITRTLNKRYNSQFILFPK